MTFINKFHKEVTERSTVSWSSGLPNRWPKPEVSGFR